MKRPDNLLWYIEVEPGSYCVESWECVDCSMNTAPGSLIRSEYEELCEQARMRRLLENRPTVFALEVDQTYEVFHVSEEVWQSSGLGETDGVLCVGCLEKRIGRRLRPRDFPKHELNTLPCTDRLWSRKVPASLR